MQMQVEIAMQDDTDVHCLTLRNATSRYPQQYQRVAREGRMLTRGLGKFTDCPLVNPSFNPVRGSS